MRKCCQDERHSAPNLCLRSSDENRRFASVLSVTTAGNPLTCGPHCFEGLVTGRRARTPMPSKLPIPPGGQKSLDVVGSRRASRHHDLSTVQSVLKHNLTAVRLPVLRALIAANVTAHAALGGLPVSGADAHVSSAARLAPILVATPSPTNSAPAQPGYTVTR